MILPNSIRGLAMVNILLFKRQREGIPPYKQSVCYD
nr:MAG TPA: hypothetical protein [Caudoviricetes sp.]